MRLVYFQPILALGLAATWHDVSVIGETYVVRCAGEIDFQLEESDVVNSTCDGKATVNIADDGADAVEVSAKNSIATITVREGTTTKRLQFFGYSDFKVAVDIQNTDFSKATSLQLMMFNAVNFTNPNTTLTVPDSLTDLYIVAAYVDDLGLTVSDNSALTNLKLGDTYSRIPRILYERKYTSKLNAGGIVQFINFDWTGTQELTEAQIANLTNNIGDLSTIGLTLVEDCSGSSNTSTHLVCTSDSTTSAASGSGNKTPGTPNLPGAIVNNSTIDSNSSNGTTTEESSGGGSSTTTVIIVVFIVAIIVVPGLLFLFIRRRRSRKLDGAENTQTLIDTVETPPNRYGKPVMHEHGVPDQLAHSRPWDDDIIVKARIPSDKLKLGTVMSRGAFGEVYRGSYRGQPVAVKMLHPSMRHETNHIELFFQEIKIMATLEHPNIVQFVGVAWDSLTEVCAVSELMDGGDLRTLLMEYHESRKPQGFDSVKIKIAADVAHALTYLHSLQPIVLHRDLKSRNILLSADRKTAKVTDFGTSRERADITMTIGVGTSLWMAPEVIMGGRYDDKADIFSFGVVLSELATHELPYAHATKTASDEPISVAAIMQAVVSGHMHLDFATSATHLSAEIVALAYACTRLDPSTRPAAAEVAWKLIQILRKMTN